MKKPLFLLFTGLLLSCLIPVHTVAAQELPTQKETLENIIKVNDYFMKSMPITLLPVFMVVYVPAISGRVVYIMKD